MSLSDLMRNAGIVQRGKPGYLRRTATPLRLPQQTELAQAVHRALTATADDVQKLYPFHRGMGMAAPQIGLNFAAAVVYPQAGGHVYLMNPRIVALSPDLTNQHEGCLSFFDDRGIVLRHAWIDVECDLLDGTEITRRYMDNTAALVAHEIDHLNGIFYTDRMAEGETTVPAEPQ